MLVRACAGTHVRESHCRATAHRTLGLLLLSCRRRAVGRKAAPWAPPARNREHHPRRAVLGLLQGFRVFRCKAYKDP